MKKRIRALLVENKLDCFGFLPLDDCKIMRPYLLERVNISRGSVVLFAIPYYTHACDGKRNLSTYAVSDDYHLYFKTLSDRLLSVLRAEFPQNRFAAFADHSPIDERTAAAAAGLGVLGKNGLLITEKYSSYVFLGEILTDAALACKPLPIRSCLDCGACKRVCPLNIGECQECLSSLTQRKGTLSSDEEQILLKYGSVWGCDLCQEVCPHTKKAKQNGTLYTPISFFSKNSLPVLTRSILLAMDDEAFAARAYSWRGKEVILRNLALAEKKHEISKTIPKHKNLTKKDNS